MFAKFKEGLVFGAGFAISYIVIWYSASYLIYPSFIASRITQEANKQLSEAEKNIITETPKKADSTRLPETPFFDLSVEDQIKKSTVIALARFEKAEDGKMKAVIQEFLKKDPNVSLYYKVGDEFPDASFYPRKGYVHGDGVVIFLTGSPARMKASMSFDGDRIRGLGDIPLELFRNKCK